MSLSRKAVCGIVLCGLAVSGVLFQRALAAPDQTSETASEKPVVKRTVDATPGTSIGRRVPNFVVADPSGKLVALADFHDKRFIVVTFITCACPLSNQYIPILNELAGKYAEQGVLFLAINSHAGDTPEKVAAHARDFELGFPVLCDPMQSVSGMLGATRTCESFVLDPQRYIRYQGRIDDRYQHTAKRDLPSRHDLASAIDELLADGDVAVKSTEVAGCLLSRPRRSAPRGEVTWAKQVSRILQEKCQDCHHPETAAPFSLVSYDDAVNWAAMIREVVVQRRMPPWHADPRFGSFSEERRLSQDEIDTLLAWIDDGAPEGNPQEAPRPIDYPDGWRIGEPDVIFELPREVTIPAKGTIPYMYFETPTNFEQDMWIQAAEARPDNRAAVHHIILFYKKPGEKRGSLQRNWIDGSAPGNIPAVFPAGVGRKIPAGATLLWQMHYTATGKIEKDRSKYGLKFCKTPPEREAQTAWIANDRFRIPPGDPNFEVKSQFKFPREALLYSFSPHMHVRGKDFEYKAIYPDGTSEILLSVPQYDFNWQSAYRLSQPKVLPAGTKIECTAHYDNSKGNRANPNPEKPVFWGDQTWEEMMIGYADFVWTGSPETAKDKTPETEPEEDAEEDVGEDAGEDAGEEAP